MKFLWPIAFTISTLWATVATYQYWRLKSNPLVFSLKQDAEVGADTKNLDQIERLSFVRQFVDRYVSFEPDNFWQGQTALSFLMASELREKRLQEISRLKEKIIKNNITQRGHILSVEKDHDHYIVHFLIDLSEGKSTQQLFSSVTLKLGEAPRSLENPWGLVISSLSFSPIEGKPKNIFDGHLYAIKEAPVLLHFPCAVENLEVPPGAPVSVKITTLNVSEIQLFLNQDLAQEMRLKAYCHQKEFAWSLSAPGKEERTQLFIEVPDSAGHNRLAQDQSAKKAKKKNAYQKTIEDELGFVIEE